MSGGQTSRANTPAAAWIIENLSALATEITETMFQRNSRLQSLGEYGRRKCSEDAAYHLHFLGEAIAVDSIETFVSYIAWAKIMLSSRGIDADDLATNLTVLKEVLTSHAPKHAPVLETFVDAAIRRFPEMPLTTPPLLPDCGPFSSVANEFLSSLLALNAEGAMNLIEQEIGAGLSIADLFEHVITPVQHEVGRLWQLNQISVVQEHYCTASIDTLIASLQRRALGVNRNVSALAFCPGDEQHCLAVRMFAKLLQADGWATYYFGPRTPTSSALQFMTKAAMTVNLIAVSVTLPVHLTAAGDLISQVRRFSRDKHPPRIVVGGRAFAHDAAVWRNLGADAYAGSLVEGLEVANRLVR